MKECEMRNHSKQKILTLPGHGDWKRLTCSGYDQVLPNMD